MFFAIAETGSGFLELIKPYWLGFQVVFGIGLMIFIHELGHFLAAKKIGVGVETFSLGFGPRLFGFKRGETDYRFSAVPLGGYVKLTGENPDEAKTGSPKELQNRSVFERMIIFGAGVFLNFLFAFITFPIIFTVGVPFIKAEVGEVFTGGPAWKAGLEPGDKVLEVDGNTIYEFNDIPLNIALGNGENCHILIERKGKRFYVDVAPEKNMDAGRYQILVSWPTRHTVKIDKGSPAESAGFRDGDRLVSINGAPTGEWLKATDVEREKPLLIEVARKTDLGESNIELTLIPEEVLSDNEYLIGITQRFNLVKAIRGSLEDRESGLLPGDFILEINGTPVYSEEDIDLALDRDSDKPIGFEVLRNNARLTVDYEAHFRPLLKHDLSIVPNNRTNSVMIMPGGALDKMNNSEVRDGMFILAVNGGKTETFDDISEAVGEASSTTHQLTVRHPGEKETRAIEVNALPKSRVRYGFNFTPDLQIRNLNAPDAIKAGFNCSIYMIKTCYLTLSRILTGDVATKNLGGIITISRASYSFAELGLARLFFFLAILSINLGFLNILPIPVLDGGHLFFLLIEKIKGSPVSDRIMGYSQIAGMAFVLALLVYVTYNDILRLFY